MSNCAAHMLQALRRRALRNKRSPKKERHIR